MGKRQFLKMVTVTGADDFVAGDDLIRIAKEYPFVEFGILLVDSCRHFGRARFPSLGWQLAYLHGLSKAGVRLSGHLCGRWALDILRGDWSIIRESPLTWHFFDRFQINTHGHRLGFKPNIGWLLYPGGRDIIFQMDGVNGRLLLDALHWGYKATGLFDLSHGAGILPDRWPNGEGLYMGYAGGLGPENVAEQLEKIEQVAGDLAWIDAETRLRSADDRRFDLDKIVAFLEAAKPWVVEESLRSGR